MKQNRKIGFWILIGIACFLNILYLLGQTMALINYDFTVAIELQEPAKEITEVGVALNKGFGMGDTIFYIPLFVIGIIGLLKKTAYGLYAMSGALAITTYWPIVVLTTVYYAKGTPEWHFSDYTSYSILLTLIAIYGLWGLWYIFKYRTSLVHNP